MVIVLFFLRTCHWNALGEWVSCEIGRASANSGVTYNPALGVGSARSWTRISTLSVDTGHVGGTFAVARAFRTTLRWSSNVIGQTSAGGRVIDQLTLSVGTATLTRIDGHVWSYKSLNDNFVYN